MASLSKQNVEKTSLHRILQAEVENAKQGKGHLVSFWGRRVQRWLLPHDVTRFAPDVKCVVLVS